MNIKLTSTPSTNNNVLDPQSLRKDYPILQQRIYRDRALVYLDNAASTQRPDVVIDAMSDCYRESYANVHRGIHWLSEQASSKYEEARRKLRRMINASHANEVIFTAGTTAAINTVAYAWGDANVAQGDQILLPIFEHHSNIVPWQQLAARVGAEVRFVQLDEQGNLDLDDLKAKLNGRVKMLAFAAVSNVLGTLVPVEEVVRLAQANGTATLVDAAQQAPHSPMDVQAWDADFVVFSGHKMVGPSGIGVLYGKQQVLDAMPPFLGGGSMIGKVTTDGFTPGELPAKFEAGTPPIVEAIGLGAAADYLSQIGLDAIEHHESLLVQAAYEQLQTLPDVRILGPPADQRAGLLSFVVEGVSPQDIAVLLDQQGVAIRAGHHCAMPLHQQLEIRSSCRASFYLYNTLEEVQQFVDALAGVIKKLR